MIDPHTIERVQKAIDYQCSDLRSWVNLAMRGSSDLALAGAYQLAHNVLVNLREKIEAEAFLESQNLDTYQKAEPIYLQLSFRPADLVGQPAATGVNPTK